MATAVWMAKEAEMAGTRVRRKGLRKFVTCRRLVRSVILKDVAVGLQE